MYNTSGGLPHDRSQQGSWAQPALPHGLPASSSHYSSNIMHSSTSHLSTQSGAPRVGSQLLRPPIQQQWSAPAAAAAAAATTTPAPSSFNYGFGDVRHAPPDQYTFTNSNPHNSTRFMDQAGGTRSISQQPGHQHIQPAPAPETDSLKSVKDLPAAFQSLFSFRYFNPVQSECFDVACGSDVNMVISAPTGAGKTGVMELALLRLLSKHLTPSAHDAQAMRMPPPEQQLQRLHGTHKTVYLGPIKALVQERQADWQARFGQVLGLKVVQLTGDDDSEGLDDLESADIICSTPEKFDQVTRKVAEKGSMGFFAEVGLVLLDEVHLLNESGRGSSLEAGCVCRIKAVAAFPEMAKAPVASVRFVAVSATIPNIGDIAQWLSVPPQGLRQYGYELRPCKLTTHVKGYAPSKNDFLFERRLNDHVYTILKEYSKGRPALVFCSSRKGTIEAAGAIVKEAEAQAQVAAYSASAGGSTGSTFVRDMQQLQRLRAAAANTQAKALAAVLVAGVGFHNAAMEPADRTLVETLFKANDLAVLCTTSTLAMGVNLPAHLVVLKGTVRWVGDTEVLPGEQPGYKEYFQTEVLQMVGRAGRPQFDTEGVAVIMTSRDNTGRYQQLLAGQVVESCLLSNLPEHLNAEIVLGTVKDVSQAIAWIRSTFLFTRVRANPQHYGLKLKPGATEAELDALLRDQIVLQPVKELMKYQLTETDEDNYSLTATAAGKLMAAHFLKLRTMASIVQLGQRPNVPSLLRVICSAEEFKSASLRRSEKRVLNEINHSKDPQQLRYHVMASKEGNKVKERISLPAEKLFILLNDALADKPSESLDYSLKQEQTRLVVVGQRIAKCMAKYYSLHGSFSSAGRSLLLTRSLKARLWEDSHASVRQLPSVGRQLSARLAAAGLGRLQAVAECGDAHKLEVAAQKPYPWGSELLAALKASTPPPLDLAIQVLEQLGGGRRGYSCQVTLTRRAAAPAAAAVAAAHIGTAATTAQQHGSSAGPGLQAAAATHTASDAAGRGSSGSSFSPCKLLVGCSSTDDLLLLRSLVPEKIETQLQLKFKVVVPPGVQQPLTVTAMLLYERIIGFDQKSSITLQAFSSQQQHRNRLAGSTSRQYLEDQGGDAGSMALDAAACEDLLPADADMEVEEMLPGQQDVGRGMGVAGGPDGMVQQKPPQRLKRSREPAAADKDVALERGSAGSSDAAMAAELMPSTVPGAANMLPPAKRSRNVARQHHALTGLQQPQQLPAGQQQHSRPLQSHQHSASAASHSSEAASMPRASIHAGSASKNSYLPSAAAAAVQSSIAARYRSVFSVGAAGHLSSKRNAAGPNEPSQQLQPAPTSTDTAAAGRPNGPNIPSGGVPAPKESAGGTATDAAELQVTPAPGPDRMTAALPPSLPGLQQGLPCLAMAQHKSSSAAQLQQQAAGHDGGIIRDVGQAMSSLFDLLADDDDDDNTQWAPQQQQEDRQQQPQQPLLQDQHFSQPSGGSCKLAERAGCSAPGMAAAVTGLLAPSNSMLSVATGAQQPLPQLNRGRAAAEARGPAGPAGSNAVAPGRMSASAVFGAAVQRSHKETASLVSGVSAAGPTLHAVQKCSSQNSLQSVLSSRALHPGGPAVAQQQQEPEGGVLLGRAGSGPLRVHDANTAQQLATPPRQIIKSMFVDTAAGATPAAERLRASPGLTVTGKGQQGRLQHVAAGGWGAGRDRGGSMLQHTREAPNFKQFAFNNAGPNPSCDTQPEAGFKPSANAIMFCHLPAGPHRGTAMGKLLGRPAASTGQLTLPRDTSNRTAGQGQQQQQLYNNRSMLQSRRSSAAATGEVGEEQRGRPAASWQRFVAAEQRGQQQGQLPVKQPGVGSHGEMPDDARVQHPGPEGMQQQQQKVSRQAARATWQGTSGSSWHSMAGSHTPSSSCGSGLKSDQSGAGLVCTPPADALVHPAGPQRLGAPAVAAPEPFSEPAAAPAPQGAQDNLDLADIFAFMR